MQQQLASHVKGVRQARESSSSILAGLLFDPEGGPLVPVHASKGRARYRYYVSKAHQHGLGSPASPALRMPAREIEQVALKELAALLADPLQLAARCGIAISPAMLASVEQRCAALNAELATSANTIVRTLIKSITVHFEKLTFMIDPAGLVRLLRIQIDTATLTDMNHEVSVRLTRTGLAVRLVQDNGAAAVGSAPEPSIIRLLIKARCWWIEIAQGQVDIATLARRDGVTPSYLTRAIRLNFLAPKVIEAALEGGLNASICGKDFMVADAIDASWRTQADRFLPGAASRQDW